MCFLCAINLHFSVNNINIECVATETQERILLSIVVGLKICYNGYTSLVILTY